MSILCDCNQFLISSMLINNQINNEVDLVMIKKLFINKLNSYTKQFPKYGNIVLCFDNQNYWRKGIFSYYKYNRKNDRKTSATDWNKIFSDINVIKKELVLSSYIVMDVEGAEADDIIASIAKYEHENNTPTLIISGDKDFIQLLQYDTVCIYNQQKKLIIKNDSYGASLL